jgi:hypothetical protein
MAAYEGPERRSGPYRLDEAQMEAIAHSAGTRAASEVMSRHWQIIGYDINSPSDVQRLQGDFTYIRGSHKRFSAVTSWVGRAVVLAITGAIIAIFALGWKVVTGHPPSPGGPFQ